MMGMYEWEKRVTVVLSAPLHGSDIPALESAIMALMHTPAGPISCRASQKTACGVTVLSLHVTKLKWPIKVGEV